MNQNEIQMPEYLNASYEGDDLYTGDQVRELIKLVAAKEREACNAICKEAYEWAESRRERDGSDPHFAGRMRAAQDIGQAIRARGEA
jgi:hypothetical protein